MTKQGIAAVMVGWLLVGCGPSEAEKALASRSARILEMQRLARDHLKDPDSANFRNGGFSGSGAYCGEVNSKNSMGGYVGFERFIVVPDRFVVFNGANTIPLNGGDDAAIASIDSQLATLAVKNALAGRALGMGTTGPFSREEYFRASFEDSWAKHCK